MQICHFIVSFVVKVNLKVKLYGIFGVEKKLHSFSRLVLDECEWSDKHTGCFKPAERTPSHHLLGG